MRRSPSSVISHSIYAHLFAMEMKIMISSGGEYDPGSKKLELSGSVLLASPRSASLPLVSPFLPLSDTPPLRKKTTDPELTGFPPLFAAVCFSCFPRTSLQEPQ